MGIRFNCPNGHRLNVKTFLAGKRGYCPHCGVKLVIPLESEPAATNAPATRPAVANSASHQQTAKASATPTASPAANTDISDAAAMWYVRPPSGGQFGPATADVINQWIDEGRVPQDSLMWKEGWADWKSANTVLGDQGKISVFESDAFDDVSSLDLEQEAGNPEINTSGEPALTIATATLPEVGKAKKRAKLQTKAVVFLSIATILLLAVLLVIIY